VGRQIMVDGGGVLKRNPWRGPKEENTETLDDDSWAKLNNREIEGKRKKKMASKG